MSTCTCKEPLEGFKIDVGPRCRLCNLQLGRKKGWLEDKFDAIVEWLILKGLTL